MWKVLDFIRGSPDQYPERTDQTFNPPHARKSPADVFTSLLHSPLFVLQDGALDLLKELKNMKMSLETLQVSSSTPSLVFLPVPAFS